MSTRREFISAIALAWPAAVLAQARGRVPRIGVLTLRPKGHELEAEFVAGLKEQGYRDGETIAIDWRYADNDAARLPAMAAELVALKVELIVAASTQAIVAAQKATSTIPILFPANADPVGVGLVKSLSRPGGNVTGLSTIAADLGGKQIELLQQMLPRLSRIAVLVNPTNAGSATVVKRFAESGQKAGVAVSAFEAKSAAELPAAFAAMKSARADAVTVAIDGLFNAESGRIAKLALEHKLPFVSTQRADAEAGGLMSYGHSLTGNYRRIALYVDRVLKGARPADMPVEQPMILETVINQKTAKALGIKVPQQLLLRADRVIE